MPMLHRKKISIFLIAVVLLIGAGIFTYLNIFKEVHTLSPDHQYMVSYNKFTKLISTTKLSNRRVHYTEWDHAKDPHFFWSTDSRYLALTFIDVSGSYNNQIIDFEAGNGMSIPMKSEIQSSCPQTQTINNNPQKVYFSDWLDNGHILVKFSWPSDTPGREISGWYTLEVYGRKITDLHVSTTY